MTSRVAARFPISHGLFHAARTHKGYAAELLRELALHPGQELIIMTLADDGPQRQGQLAEIEGLDHSTIAKSLRRMEAAGLVKRRPSNDDRRVSIVSLTTKGKALHKKVEAAWGELERASVSQLNERERTSLLRLLRAIETGVAAPG